MMGSKTKFLCKEDINFRWKPWTVPSRSPQASTDNNCDEQNHENDDTGESSSFLQVSNDTCPTPKGLTAFHDFISLDEANQLYREILENEFQWEGFEQRRRVQRYEIPPQGQINDDDDDAKKATAIPKTLFKLLERLAAVSGHWPQHVSVLEYLPQYTLKITQYGSRGYNQVVTNFETANVRPCTCSDKNNKGPSAASSCHCCSSFVAQLPLKGGPVIQHLNKPIRRHNTCFDLETAKHWTDMRLEERDLLLQTGDCLWNWRSRISALPLTLTTSSSSEMQKEPQQQKTKVLGDTKDPFLVLKFCRLPPESSSDSVDLTNEKEPSAPKKAGSECWNYDDFGYIGTPETNYRSTVMPPIEDILTIIVTTSPIKSNPSTEILERSFGTFLNGGNNFAIKCRKVIVCDGCRVLDNGGEEKVSKRHANIKQAMRNGICTSDQAENYRQFKAALRELCANATSCSPFYNATIDELDSRHGYGFALRHALRHCVSTPYVCVIQHDRSFMRPTPMEETMRAMWHHRNVKYVTMSMRSNLTYRDQFQGKHGKTYYDEFDNMTLRLPELNLDKSQYGPGSHSTHNIICENKRVLDSMKGNMNSYKGSKQNTMQLDWLKENPPVDPNKHQLTLTPTLFWYDNVHIAETEHYRDFVFNPIYKMVKKGGFVEDKLSPLITRTLERLGLREGHSRFGCYILDDHSGYFFTGHFDGGAYVAKAKREEERQLYSKDKISEQTGDEISDPEKGSG